MPVTPLAFSHSDKPPDVDPGDQRYTPITDLDDVPDDESEDDIPEFNSTSLKYLWPLGTSSSPSRHN
jgi:hypothetical protein